MPNFNYIVRDQEGIVLKGTITADSESAVVAQLRKDDIIIVSIEEEQLTPVVEEVAEAVVEEVVTPEKSPKIKKSGKKITTKDVVVFSRQFATMIDASVPISQAMEVLSEQALNPSLRAILKAICEDVRDGNGLSNSFAKYPEVFDALYVNMLRVGESGGILNQVLERTALYLEKSEKLKQKIQGAMIYPIAVVSIALLITSGLIIKVVPTFAGIYDSLGQKLPAMTQVLIDFSQLMRKYFLVFIGVLFVGSFALAKYRKTPDGSLQIDRFLLKIPIFGDMICKVTVSRFCHTFATLIQSGVPILEALEVVKQSSGNRVIELLTEDIKASVKEGDGISIALAKAPIFPAMVTRMISIGEKSGQLDKMLMKVAEFYDEELDAATEGLTKIIEPVIIGFLGIVIGFIVVALFLPILNMATALK